MPPCLFDYLPRNSLLIIDESHVAIPQLRGMYRGDRSRKETAGTGTAILKKVFGALR